MRRKQLQTGRKRPTLRVWPTGWAGSGRDRRRCAGHQVGVAAVTCLALLILIPPPVAAVPAADNSFSVRDSIQSLRLGGRYLEALQLSDDLLAELRAADAAPAHEIASAEWLQKSLAAIVAMPPDDLAFILRSDSLELQYDKLVKKRRLGDAVGVLAEIIDIRHRLLGESPEVAHWMQRLGAHYNGLGQQGEAREMLSDALEIQLSTLGLDHPETASTLASLSHAIVQFGHTAQADSLARLSLTIRTRLFGPSHLDVAHSLNALALVAYHSGDLVTSEIYDRQKLSILLQHYGSDNPQVISALHDLAVTLVDQSDFNGALELYERSLEVLREKYGENHFYVAFTMQNMSVPLTSLGRYEEAEAVLRKAMPFVKQYMGETSESAGTNLVNLGTVLTELGRYAEADSLLHAALAIRRTNFPPGHAEIGTNLMALGVLRHRQGRTEEATEYFRQAEDILRNAVGGGNIGAYAAALHDHALVLIDEGEYVAAREKLELACEFFELARRRVSSSELQRAPFTAELSPYRLLALTDLELDRGDSAWIAAERECARSLLDLLSTRSLRQLTGDETRRERRLNDELVRIEEALSAVDADSLRQLLAEKEAEWKSFQRELSLKYPLTEGSSYTLSRVQSRLSPGSAILGWLDVKGESFVYLVTPSGPVLWSKLEPAPEARIYSDFVAAIARRDSDPGTLRELARRIYRHRLAPIEAQLAEIRRLHVIPSGSMLGVPVEALTNGDDEFIVDRCEVSYTPSATILTWLEERPPSSASETLLALGDPPFSNEQALAMDAGRAAGDDEDVNRSATRSSPVDITGLPRLTGTRKEVESISRLVPSPTTLLGRRASEGQLQRMAAGGELFRFRFIHLATHAIPDNMKGERSALILSQIDLSNPVEAIARGERIIDGRLTMDEVMREWRLDAELVVLSACETALGEAAAGEGYIGFAHAFFRAGTRSLLVSLWKVADRPTRLLMTRFYENLIERGMSRSAALREAKQYLRSYGSADGRAPYSHPAFWAGFVLIGDSD